MSHYKPRFETTEKIQRLKGQIVKLGKKGPFIHATSQMYHNASLRDSCFSLALEKHISIGMDDTQAAENAYKAYSAIYHRQYESIDVYSSSEMLGAHRAFMAGLSNEAGRFRNEKLISNCMDALLSWAKTTKEDAAVKSCVFHYELMQIRPFSEGNGLVARMWQTLLHMQCWYMPIRMPLWNIVDERQRGYYDALAISNDSTVFIEFMLEVIRDAIQEDF